MFDQEPAFKKLKPEQKRPEESGAKMNDLPELPFEKILGYLSLQDLLRSRAVSRRWCKTIDSFKVKSLFYSAHTMDLFYQNSRWIGGRFAQNFIRSTRFEAFFQTFGQSILSNLKHLRLFDIFIDGQNRTAVIQIFNSFGRLEILQIRYLLQGSESNSDRTLELNLPMLNSIQLELVTEIDRLILNAPRLQKIKVCDCESLRLDIVHFETVETLISETRCLEVDKLKNLKYLYTDRSSVQSSTLLSSLEQLKEIHLQDFTSTSEILKQKQRYLRTDLKIFFRGLLLNGPADLAKCSASPGSVGFDYLADDEVFRHLTENPSVLATEIPLYPELEYAEIERFAPRMQKTLLNRLTDLHSISISEPIQDIQRFLDFVKGSDIDLYFRCDQSQDLFDRLPDYCPDIQMVHISMNALDWGFLFRFKKLICFQLNYPVEVELLNALGQRFKELKFLLVFEFKFANKAIRIDFFGRIGTISQERLTVSIGEIGEWETEVPDISAAIELLKAIEEQPSA